MENRGRSFWKCLYYNAACSLAGLENTVLPIAAPIDAVLQRSYEQCRGVAKRQHRDCLDLAVLHVRSIGLHTDCTRAHEVAPRHHRDIRKLADGLGTMPCYHSGLATFLAGCSQALGKVFENCPDEQERQ